MAKIQEEIYVVKLSKLARNNQEDSAIITNVNFNENLETIIQELVDENIVVEVEKYDTE